MRKRHLLLAGAALTGAMTLAPAVASQAMTAKDTTGAAISASQNKPNPQTQRQYDSGYDRGYRDADNNCYSRDVTNRPRDYRRGWDAGYFDGGC